MNKCKKSICTFLLIFFAPCLLAFVGGICHTWANLGGVFFAQPTKQWDKRFGTSSTDNLNIVIQTTDGGYILGGMCGNLNDGDKTQVGQGSNDYWIVKTDASGTKQWDKRFGGSDDDRLYSIWQTTDGGYILGGMSLSGISGDRTQASQGNFDYWIVKIDASGNKQWDRRFGGAGEDVLSALKQTTDGGYILGGRSWSGISGDRTQANWGISDYWVVKLDASANKQWDRRFGGLSTDDLSALQQTTDGGYILGGSSTSNPGGDCTQGTRGVTDYWLVKIDASGNKQWDKRFGGTENDYLTSLKQTTDGGYILGGYSESDIGGDKTQARQGPAFTNDYWVVKTDASGTKQWDKRFGGNSDDFLFSLQQTTDGGYILGGRSRSGISGDKTEASWGQSDYWIVKTDASGTKQWDKRFGGSDYDDFTSLQQTSDGRFILGGQSRSGISGDRTQASRGMYDYWIVKTGQDPVLPIALFSFSATPVKDTNDKYYVRCQWTTATEINNDYFTVERSPSPSFPKVESDWLAIGTIAGAGNSTTTKNYEFIDVSPSIMEGWDGLRYYRLKQTDYDGKFTYSDIVPVYIGALEIISIYPNPAQEEVKAIIAVEESTEAQAEVFNVLGGQVIQQTVSLKKGTTEVSMNVKHLAAGTYTFRVTLPDKEQVQKMFVK